MYRQTVALRLLVGLAASAATATLAEPPGGAPAAASASADTARKDARAIAELAAPRDSMISMNLEWGRRAVAELPRLNEESKLLEQDYPGIHAAMWTAAEGELARQLEVDLPVLWGRLEQLYVAELNPRELRAVLDFYRTPTGQRLIRSIYTKADLQPMIESIAASEDGTISEESMRRVQATSKVKAVADAKPAEADILPLMKAISLGRLQAVGEKVQQVTMDWVNESDPEDQAKIDALMADAAEGFIASRDAQSK